MSGHPIRREELIALELMGRGQAFGGQVEEAVMLRLQSLGLVEQQRGKWSITQRGIMDLQRRKSMRPSKKT